MDVLIVAADTPVGIELQRLFAHWGRHRSQSVSVAASRFRSERQAKKVARRGRPQALVDLRLAALLAAGRELQSIDVERCHWLAKACERGAIRYLLVSSDRVFSGAQQRALRETDQPDAQDDTGRALIDAETRVSEAAAASLILRTGPLFSGTSEDRLLGRVLADIIEKRRARLDNSELFCPSAATDVARVLAALLDQIGAGAPGNGCYHYCSPDRSSHYGFAEVALASASQYADLGDVQLETLEESTDTGGARVLDCNRLRDGFAIKQLPWRAQINVAVKAFLRARQHPGETHET